MPTFNWNLLGNRWNISSLLARRRIHLNLDGSLRSDKYFYTFFKVELHYQKVYVETQRIRRASIPRSAVPKTAAIS